MRWRRAPASGDTPKSVGLGGSELAIVCRVLTVLLFAGLIGFFIGKAKGLEQGMKLGRGDGSHNLRG